MYDMIKQNDNVSAYVTEFVADTVADVALLPTTPDKVYPGSTCLVAEGSKVFVLNASRQWVEL